MNRHLCNMVSSIKNGQLSKKSYINLKQTNKQMCESVLNVLWDEGFILGYKTDSLDPTKLKIFLKYTKNKPAIQTIKSVSKSGSKVYYSLKQLWKIDSSKTFLVISTNLGVKTLTDCKKLQIGGEPFLIIN